MDFFTVRNPNRYGYILGVMNMTLTEKLSEISKTALPEMEEGYANDIKTFWHDFVEPKLPEKETVLAWHGLLTRYVQDDDAVFVIRAFSNTNATPRRGLLTRTDKDFSFTYADNGFAKLIAKMAMDGFCPKYNEFKESMLTGKMPVSEFMGSKERQRALYKQQMKADYAGYKLAHIVDSGKDFFVDGWNCRLTEICRKHFPAGEFDDWKIEGNIYVRRLSVSPGTRDILSAYFLRYVDPLNYFLTPKPKNNGAAFHTTETGISDIAEHKPFQLYAMRQFYGRFGQAYKDFLNLLKIPPLFLNHFKTETTCGDTVIKIHYGKKFVDVADKNKSKSVTDIEESRNVPQKTSCKSKSARSVNTAEYSATRLTFKRDEIERLTSEGLIIIHTPDGTFEMKKSDFYATFRSVVVSESYQKNGVYHYPKTPQKAYRFCKKL